MSDDDAAPTTTTNCRVEARNNLNLQPVRQTIVYGEWSRRDEREVHGFILPLYYRANTSSSIASYLWTATRHVRMIVYTWSDKNHLTDYMTRLTVVPYSTVQRRGSIIGVLGG